MPLFSRTDPAILFRVGLCPLLYMMRKSPVPELKVHQEYVSGGSAGMSACPPRLLHLQCCGRLRVVSVRRLIDVLEQLASRQLGHLVIQILKVVAKRGMDVMERFELVEAWHERQGVLATPEDP